MWSALFCFVIVANELPVFCDCGKVGAYVWF